MNKRLHVMPHSDGGWVVYDVILGKVLIVRYGFLTDASWDDLIDNAYRFNSERLAYEMAEEIENANWFWETL